MAPHALARRAERVWDNLKVPTTQFFNVFDGLIDHVDRLRNSDLEGPRFHNVAAEVSWEVSVPLRVVLVLVYT